MKDMNKLLGGVLITIGAIVIGFLVLRQEADEPAPLPDSTQVESPSPSASPTPQQTVTPIPTPTPTPTATPTATPEPTPTPTAVREFNISADDSGYEPAGALSVNQDDTVRITFTVKTEDVNFGGLDFRGGPVDTGPIAPGQSKTVEFTAESSFDIRSFWPNSGVMKPYKIPVQVNVQ